MYNWFLMENFLSVCLNLCFAVNNMRDDQTKRNAIAARTAYIYAHRNRIYK